MTVRKGAAASAAELLTAHEVAALSGFDVETVRRQCKRGSLAATKLCGEWRIAVAAYEAWVAGAQRPPAEMAPRPERPRVAASSTFRERRRAA